MSQNGAGLIPEQHFIHSLEQEYHCKRLCKIYCTFDWHRPHFQLLSTVPHNIIKLVQHHFFNPTIWKSTATAFQSPLTLINILSILGGLGLLDFTAPKKNHITYFFKTNTLFYRLKKIQPTPSENFFFISMVWGLAYAQSAIFFVIGTSFI